MKKIKDSSLEKIRKFNKYKDIYDFKSLECNLAIIFTILFLCVFILVASMEGKDVTINKIMIYLDNIGVALIGLLGFIVTGLSILTGMISSKVVAHLQSRKKMDLLEKILLSYYLLGILSASMIMEIGVLHFLSMLSIESNFLIDSILVIINVYIFTFIIFYAVKLIGNCLEIFCIVNSMHILVEQNENSKSQYNEYKVKALEEMLIGKNGDKLVDEYKKNIKKMIDSDGLAEQDEKGILVHFYGQFNDKYSDKESTHKEK